MELILAILGAAPVGFLMKTRRRGLAVYLCLWAAVFPIQTTIVSSESDGGGDALYWIFNALILGLGIGLNRCGALLGERRRARLGAAQAGQGAA